MTNVTMRTGTATMPVSNVTGAEHHDDAFAVRVQASMKKLDDERKARWETYDLPSVTPISTFADYAAAIAWRSSLAQARANDLLELSKATTAISRGFAARQDDETERKVQAVMAGRPNEAFDGFEELNGKVARLRDSTTIQSIAVSRQDETIATIRSERSIDAAEAMAPAHRDAVAAIVAAIAQLRVAFDREEAARSKVKDAGYDDRLTNFGSGNLLRVGSQLNEIERRAVEYSR